MPKLFLKKGFCWGGREVYAAPSVTWTQLSLLPSQQWRTLRFPRAQLNATNVAPGFLWAHYCCFILVSKWVEIFEYPHRYRIYLYKYGLNGRPCCGRPCLYGPASSASSARSSLPCSWAPALPQSRSTWFPWSWPHPGTRAAARDLDLSQSAHHSDPFPKGPDTAEAVDNSKTFARCLGDRSLDLQIGKSASYSRGEMVEKETYTQPRLHWNYTSGLFKKKKKGHAGLHPLNEQLSLCLQTIYQFSFLPPPSMPHTVLFLIGFSLCLTFYSDCFSSIFLILTQKRGKLSPETQVQAWWWICPAARISIW